MENEVMNPNAPVSVTEMYNRSLETFRGGGEILATNQALASKIVAAGQSILSKIQANGGKLTPELDKLCNDYIVKANQRKKTMEEDRKPVTQMMTAVQKLFTAEEAKIDVKIPDTEIGIIQSFRNQYARDVAEADRKQREDADRKAKKDKEVIRLKSDCETQLNQYFNTYLLQQKQNLQTRFNSIKLEEFDEVAQKLTAFDPVYTYEQHTAFKANLYAMFHSQEETANIVTNVVAGRFDQFSQRYKAEFNELKHALVARLPSKKTELQSLAQADEDERLRLEEDKRKREEDANRKLEQQAQESQQQAVSSISSNAAAEETMVLFAQEVSATPTAPAPETRQGYEIDVKTKAAYVQMFQLWWENEGKGLDPDKIEKKTIGAMKKFCETLAHKKDIKIESPHLEYVPSYKAVNRQTREA